MAKMGLTYAISKVNWIFGKIFIKEYFLLFFTNFLVFHNNIVKKKKKKKKILIGTNKLYASLLNSIKKL